LWEEKGRFVTPTYKKRGKPKTTPPPPPLIYIESKGKKWSVSTTLNNDVRIGKINITRDFSFIHMEQSVDL
jgi:hypothetical protein